MNHSFMRFFTSEVKLSPTAGEMKKLEFRGTLPPSEHSLTQVHCTFMRGLLTETTFSIVS